MTTRASLTITAIMLYTLASSNCAIAQSRQSSEAADSIAILRTVERFHSLLANGDSATAIQLLAPDVTVLESGVVQSRAEYLTHHLGADIEFAKAVPAERRVRLAGRQGDVAWTVGTSIYRGTFRNRAIDSRGAELMVLRRFGTEWVIQAIHWSSQRRGR